MPKIAQNSHLYAAYPIAGITTRSHITFYTTLSYHHHHLRVPFLLLLLILGYKLSLQLWRSRAVMTEFHRELTLALCARPQLARKAKHAVQATICVDCEVLGANLRIVDHGVALVQKTDDVTLELVGSSDGRLHQGLEDLRCTLDACLAESLLRCVFERHVARQCEWHRR